MMEAFLRTLLNMSLTGSLAILAVLLLRLALKGLPKIYSYALWTVVLFRLLCPVSVESHFSLLGALDVPVTESGSINFLPQQSQDPTAGELPPVTAPPVTQSPAVTIPLAGPGVTMPAGKPAPVTQKLTPEALAMAVYLLGVAAMGMYSVVSYLQLRRSLAEQAHLRENIYLADHIPTPFVMGLVRPRIYLPSGMEEKEQSYILLHERHHIRRGDHWVKALAFAALCMHWFNPLVWLAFGLLTRDMEMSCDEAVLQKLGTGIRAEYSQSLLRFTTGRSGFAGTPLAFGEGDAKGRIRNMKNWKKPKLWLCVLGAVACLALVICLATNPFNKSKDQVWFDCNTMKYEDFPETYTHPAFPNVVFHCDRTKVWITTPTETVEVKNATMGMMNIYLSDLNGDGKPELCGTCDPPMLSYTQHYIWVYDLVNRAEYKMRQPVDARYCDLYMVDGRMRASRTTNGENTVVSGTLTIRNSELIFTQDAVHLSNDKPAIEQGNYVTTHRWYAQNTKDSENKYRITIQGTSCSIYNQTTEEFTRFSGIKWQWRDFPWTGAQWKQICGFESPLRENFDSLGYQPLNKQFCIVKADYALWLVELKHGTVGSIYHLVNSIYEGLPTLNPNRVPVQGGIPIKVDVPYTELKVSCSVGYMVDPDNPQAQSKTVVYQKGEPVAWQYKNSNGDRLKQSVIRIAIINGGKEESTVTINTSWLLGYVFLMNSQSMKLVLSSNGMGVTIMKKP
jgi:beta-lactamase regulating signal transducer with metallopeptidase domain